LSWTNSAPAIGNGSGTLAWSSGVHQELQITFSIAIGVDIYISIACVDGFIQLAYRSFYPDGSLTYTCYMNLGSVDDYTCSPLHLHFVTAGRTGAGCNDMINNGFTDFYIDYP
jgi:hypothetical protein